MIAKSSQASVAVFAAGAAHRTQLTTHNAGAADGCDKTQPRATRDTNKGNS